MADLTSRQSPDRRVPAEKLAERRKPHFPGESVEYASARTALLAEEIRLRRQVAAVASHRRNLPEGPLIEKDYRFIGPNGDEVGLADMFGRHSTLVTYFWMYGPDRQRPCPMCTNLIGPLAANAADLRQRVGLAILGRSTVERQIAFAMERGWRNLDFYQTIGDDYARDAGGLDLQKGWEIPILAVFRKDGEGHVRLFWADDVGFDMADPGQDPRGPIDLAPLWNILDLTPDGRGVDWYPRLNY